MSGGISKISDEAKTKAMLELTSATSTSITPENADFLIQSPRRLPKQVKKKQKYFVIYEDGGEARREDRRNIEQASAREG